MHPTMMQAIAKERATDMQAQAALARQARRATAARGVGIFRRRRANPAMTRTGTSRWGTMTS